MFSLAQCLEPITPLVYITFIFVLKGLRTGTQVTHTGEYCYINRRVSYLETVFVVGKRGKQFNNRVESRELSFIWFSQLVVSKIESQRLKLQIDELKD